MRTTKTAYTTYTTTSLLPSSKPPSLPKKAWTALKKHAKEHHESVNAAHSHYYEPVHGQAYVPRQMEKTEGVGAESKEVYNDEGERGESTTRKAWAAVKKHAKEHHQSVNAAYRTYYGIGVMPEATREEETKIERQK
ncbi:hypothetical protein K505DRAFT_325905 [Melanomma pulvis-pyrius CBS 109.77]|uniref:Uncharacterized protein n=1 Tax=Melanomma pulvis-pyrius CBS 109.77 TaxID=1314802 RepID=A0A6A6X8T3_9PLEO|nr:hypothetical protein K505DRAFT_325905 [Melanomma pulvis-pyrius CBS 109.77]